MVLHSARSDYYKNGVGEEGVDFLDLLPLSKVQRNHMAGGDILKIYLLCGT